MSESAADHDELVDDEVDPRLDDPEFDPRRWFDEHYRDAAEAVVDFLAGDNISLTGKTVADIGCGDGIIDLGVFHRSDPALLVGYDLRPVDGEALGRTAREAGIDSLPPADRLSFALSEPEHLPSPPSTFDVAFSWSTFEHVSQPITMFREVRRILKPDGVFFLQIWPLYYSEHGGHLWQSIREPFPHLAMPHHVVERRLKGRRGTDRRRSGVDEFRSLNRMTLDDLQRALLAAGMRPTKVEVMSETLHVPDSIAHMALSQLLVSGVKLLAVPA